MTRQESDMAATVTAMLHAVDDLDWQTVLSHLAPEVVVDYTSLWGGEAETISSATLVERWQGLLPGFGARPAPHTRGAGGRRLANRGITLQVAYDEGDRMVDVARDRVSSGIGACAQ